MLTVMMIVYNEIEYVKLAVKSFRLFCDIDVSLIVVDNGSVDGLQEWAKEQADFTYVLLDGEHMGCGKAINRVRRELQIDTDLFIMEGHYMLLPHCLSNLLKLLHDEKDMGAVCGICNADSDLLKEAGDYKEAIGIAEREKETKRRRILMLNHNAILYRKDALELIGDFEESIDEFYGVMIDYCLRMTMMDRKLMVCSSAMLWKLGTVEDTSFSERSSWETLEKKWGMHYFVGEYNGMLIELIEQEREQEEYFRVLEVGCDCGATLMEIKNRYPNAEVYGSEINRAAVSIAVHVACVVENNIENKNLPFANKMFDYIILGDVLEHLHNPLETLMYCKELLREDGKIIANIPNLMHISVMEQLLKGNFTYADTGLLDKTHIHFFTFNEICWIFHMAGYEISDIQAGRKPITDEQDELIDHLIALEDKAEKFMYEAYWYTVKAKILQI